MMKACAHAIRSISFGGLGQVLCATWLGGELALKDALDVCPPGRVLILPLLMGEGWFADHVFPRELDVQRPRPHLLSIEVAPPLGLNPYFEHYAVAATQVALDTHHAHQVLVVGHGTPRDPRSVERTLAIVEAIRAALHTEERPLWIRAAFLDQSPTLDDILPLADTSPLVILPWFAAEGDHATMDIPTAVARHRMHATHILTSVGAEAFPLLCHQLVADALLSRQ